ncbi:MAG: hypothetical protein P8X55_02940 [Desulfosarcinaceae bacterium]
MVDYNRRKRFGLKSLGWTVVFNTLIAALLTYVYLVYHFCV